MRIQFEFSDDAVRELDALKNRLNIKYRGDVVNHALGVLKWLVNEHGLGSAILSKKKDGSVVKVEFPEIESLFSNKCKAS